MADAANVINLEEYRNRHEEYGRSLSAIRQMGASALSHEVARSDEQLAYDDFFTAVTEMLKTDKEYQQSLEVDNERVHNIHNGQVRAANGKSMVNILESGAAESASAARFMPELKHQAVRDAWDVVTAKRADALEPGMTLFGVSYFPKEALADHPEIYSDRFGYKKGLVYVQTYSKLDNKKLVAGSYSIDVTNEAAWKTAMANIGMAIPENISDDEWLKHAIELPMNNFEAKQLVDGLRDQYYASTGQEVARRSISRYVAEREHIVRRFFDAYYPALATAVQSGKNTPELQKLAHTLLSSRSNFDPAVSAQLIRMANSNEFTDESAKMLDTIIRYATVEQLRKDLGNYLGRESSVGGLSAPDTNYLSWAQYEQAALDNVLASNVREGIAANRSYGGCPGNTNLGGQGGSGEEGGGQDGPQGDQQEAYGGKGSSEDRIGKKRVDLCVVKSCPTRPNKVIVGGCGVCLGRCQKIFDAGKDPTKMGGLKSAKPFELFEKKPEAEVLEFKRRKANHAASMAVEAVAA